MADNQAIEAIKAVKAMLLASETVRSAIAAAIPVANTQVLTVSLPGNVINYKDYAYNSAESIKAPLAIRVKEAQLVDGMIPLSKFTSGKTGKSVARSYLSTLDLLVPVEASVSGAIGNETEVPVDGRLKVVKDRYQRAMTYLKSLDDTPGSNGRSKLQTYVEKQDKWSTMVEAYSKAQAAELASVQRLSIKDGREAFLQWMQEHGKNYKQAIQARYMDWVVHGYKFMIDFNFGIVDIQSGMKRVENSKEAFRNMILIGDDGSTEYSTVILSPSDWATTVGHKVESWDENNKKPTISEIRAEIRRLRSLLVSHETLQNGIETDAFFPVMTTVAEADKSGLMEAYKNVYADIDEKNRVQVASDKKPVESAALTKWTAKNKEQAGAADAPTSDAVVPADASQGGVFENLIRAQSIYNDSSLSRNKNLVRAEVEGTKNIAMGWLTSKIATIKNQIEELQAALPGGSIGGAVVHPEVVDSNGVAIRDEDNEASSDLKERLKGNPPPQPSKWTRISCKSSQSSSSKETMSFESASAVAAKVGFGFFRASGGASHTQSSSRAMSSMANLDVEISMDCMVVEIDRPWLHAELFSDAELDTGMFEVSPGENVLKDLYEKNIVPKAEYQQFSSYPTAFIIAADIELSFSGDTTQLESAVSASTTAANVSVGYGPFSVSASHSQSKSKSKTKMESTATGCKISVQAPQIVGWVQSLMPALPRSKTETRMAGMPTLGPPPKA